MLKVERRFERGKLSVKDLNLLISYGEHLRAYRILENYWDVHIKAPKVVFGKRTAFDFENPDVVSIGIKQTAKSGNLLREIGIRQPLITILNIDLGEEYTHYMNYHSVPQNFKREYDLRISSAENRSRRDFLKAASLGSQTEAIGFLGRKEVATRLGVKNHEETEWKLLKAHHKETDASFARQTSTETFEVLILLKRRSGKKYKQATESFRTLLDAYYNQSISGAGQFLIASEFEEEFSGRFPKLIRRVLEPEDIYIEKYLEFTETYYPSFKKFLDEVFL